MPVKEQNKEGNNSTDTELLLVPVHTDLSNTVGEPWKQTEADKKINEKQSFVVFSSSSPLDICDENTETKDNTIKEIVKEIDLKEETEVEEWSNLADRYRCSNYEVSNWGRIRNKKSNKISNRSYPSAELFNDDGVKVCRKVSFFVAEQFIENPRKYEYIRFKNQNRFDCHWKNLEWSKTARYVNPSEYQYETLRNKKKRQNLPIGVSISEGKVCTSWREDGEKKTKTFSINKWGLDVAKAKAIALRKEKEILLNILPLEELTGNRKKHRKRKKKRFDPYGNELPPHIWYLKRSGSGSYRIQVVKSKLQKYFTISKFANATSALSAAKEYVETWSKENPPRFNSFVGTGIGSNTTLDQQHSQFMRTAKSKKCSVSLSQKLWEKLVLRSLCHYCGFKPSRNNLNTIDRLDSSLRQYSPGNCVSSCLFCNLGRGTRELSAFLAHIRLVLLNHGYTMILPPLVLRPDFLTQIFHPDLKDLIFCRRNQNRLPKPYIRDDDRLTRFKDFAHRAKHIIDLSFQEYSSLVSSNCYYCGRSPTCVTLSIDRLNSKEHYYRENSVAACTDCNLFKKHFEFDFFISKCQQILEYQNFLMVKK